MTYGVFFAEEQKARMQALIDRFRAANESGEPAMDLTGFGPSSFSLPDLLAAADDLDRLEELEPRPGRVGLANRLRRYACVEPREEQK